MHDERLYLFFAFFLFMFLAWYFTSRARHKERLMLIEKGINPDDSSVYPNQTGISLGVKIGIVIIGLSVGLAIISILVSFNALGRSNATPPAILGLCVGISLVVANRYSKSNAGKRG